jgi:Fe-S cluster assembly ATPase SufC
VIRSLDIFNFRCFKTSNLDNVRRFNILTGTNGSGKTALLEAVFIAGGGSAEIFLRTNAWRGQNIIGITPSSLLPLFEDFFHQFDSAAGLRIKFRDSSGDQREVQITVGQSSVVNLPFDNRASESTVSRELNFTWKTPKGTIESKIEVESNGTLRLAQPEDVFPIAFLNQATAGGSKDNADRFSAISAKNLEKPVEAAVNRIFPQVTGLSVLTSTGVGTIHAAVRGVNRKIPIGLVSSGISKFVAILVSIAWAERGIVLIDEIENGLYHKLFPQMWREISEFARENKTQIFATTHSKEFLEAIAPIVDKGEKDYSLLRMEKQNGESTITTFEGKQFAGAIESGFEVR